MSNFPALIDTNTLPATLGDDVFNELQSKPSYTGYISLIQGSSDLAKPPHKMPIGTFAFVLDKKPVNLGERFAAVNLAWRPTARIVDKSGGETKITSFHSLEDPRLQEIKSFCESGARQSDGDPVRKYWGFEYLLWVPSIRKFGTFYCNSISSRIAAARAIHPLMSKPGQPLRTVEMIAEFVEKKYTYYVPDCQEIDLDLGDAVPTQEEYNHYLKAFIDATASEEGVTSEEVVDTNER